MTPKEAITKVVKSKDGKNIIVSLETFSKPVGSTQSDDYHTTLTFTDKKTNLQLGKMFYPKMTKEVMDKQMEVTITNIDDFLKCL